MRFKPPPDPVRHQHLTIAPNTRHINVQAQFDLPQFGTLLGLRWIIAFICCHFVLRMTILI